MKVEKGGGRAGGGGGPARRGGPLPNRQSRKELTAAEVYLFAVRLCDNEVDRDGGAVSTGHPGAAGGAVCGQERDL